MTEDWEAQVARAWAGLDDTDDTDDTDEGAFLARIATLVAAAPDRAAGDFEQAAAYDSTGHAERAVPLYRRALEQGLRGERRRRAVVQLASSLRNLGESPESVRLLSAELEADPDDLDDAVRAFLALALVDVGREREAVGIALGALAPHLRRYQRSLAAYARALTGPDPVEEGT